jgi:hypothetical protein
LTLAARSFFHVQVRVHIPDDFGGIMATSDTNTN